MKCNNCGAEWKASDSVVSALKQCPFCNVELQPESSTIKDVLRWIVDTRSMDIFLNTGVVNSLLADFAKSEEDERKKIRLALLSGAGSKFHRIWTICGGSFRDTDIEKFGKSIEENGFTEDFVTFIIETFLYAASAPINGVTIAKSIETKSIKTESTIVSSNETEKMLSKGLELLNNKKYKEAYEYLILVAEQGNTIAQYHIGHLYRNGYWVKEDYSEALKWYRLAAEQGDATAQYNIGHLYMNGYGVEQDYSEALKWYCLAAEQGNANAQTSMGYLYENGYGVKQGYSEALRWYRFAAEQGNVNAQTSMGYLYENGYGVEQNYSEALRWYRLAVRLGDKSAQYYIGYLFENGYGVAKSRSEALRWYRLAAGQGNANAKNKLKELLIGR